MEMRKGKSVISEVLDLANGCLQADRALLSRRLLQKQDRASPRVGLRD